MRLFVVGWFGAGNLGDEAILLATLSSLSRALPAVRFEVLSFGPNRTAALLADWPAVERIRCMGNLFHLHRSDFGGIWTSVREADLVLIGGGGLFQDLYNLYPVPFFSIIALAAKICNKPLALYGLGVGPLRTALGRLLTRWTFTVADVASVRDEGSAQVLRAIGFSGPLAVTADPVFALAPASPERALDILAAEGLPPTRGPRLGLCLQELLPWEARSRTALAAILDDLVTTEKAQVVFLPLGYYGRGQPHDLRTAHRIQATMTAPGYLIGGTYDPPEIMAVVGQMTALVSMRLHGLVMGAVMAVPLLALTYQREEKLKNMMAALEQEGSLFYVDRFQGEAFLNRVRETVRSHTGTSMAQRVALLRHKAEDNARLIAAWACRTGLG